jgi:membrane associated rhomboid family serine protease
VKNVKPFEKFRKALHFTIFSAINLFFGGMRMIFYRPEFENGAFWQLFTAQFVHLSGGHAWSNHIFLWSSVLIMLRWVSAFSIGGFFVGGVLGVAVTLLLDHDCQYYAGLSGAIHGLWAGVGLCLVLLNNHSPRAYVGIAILLFLPIKIGIQMLWSVPIVLNPSFTTYHLAHGGGALGGLLAAGCLLLFLRSRPAVLIRHHHNQQK